MTIFCTKCSKPIKAMDEGHRAVKTSYPTMEDVWLYYHDSCWATVPLKYLTYRIIGGYR